MLRAIPLRFGWYGRAGTSAIFAMATLLLALSNGVWAQDAQVERTPTTDAAEGSAIEEAGEFESTTPGATVERLETKGINVFQLLVQGGFFMLPIVLMSLLVVTFSIERFMGLRRSRILPPDLVSALGKLGEAESGFNPRQAYRVCQQYPSAAASVVRAMLLKIGRPHSEVEHTVAEASEREAARLYANVRWLNLAATVTPLLGLLGTVWGMIRAFHDTTQLAPGWNKAEYLAEGIYIALVTTLSGLAVAIPAAILSHYFEGRIQRHFHQIDELLFSLMPQIECFEGRVRFNRSAAQQTGGNRETAVEPPIQEQSPAPP